MESIRLKIYDNFLDDIDSVRNYALQDIYYPPTKQDWWLGFRSKKYNSSDSSIGGKLSRKIENLLMQNFYCNKNISFEGYFYYCPKISQEFAGETFDKIRYHTDYRSEYAGLLYLHPSPPNDTGTTLIKKSKEYRVENKYNRLVTYYSKILHGPQNFFGDDILDSRLCFVFFSESIIQFNTDSNSSNIFNL